MMHLFFMGVCAMLPAIIMLMVASSIKYIIVKSNIMDTILYILVNAIKNAPVSLSVILIYVVVFIFEFLIPSGSTKATLLMPIIYPLVDMLGINRQTAVLAFAFGDGFSNVILPTNPGVLIVLGLTAVTYPKWFKWSFKIQLSLFALTSSILLLAHYFLYT
jgi:uncharacterized ion transporter superfamily protein YfcC